MTWRSPAPPEEAARVRVRLLRELAANRESLVATHLSFPSIYHVAVDGDVLAGSAKARYGRTKVFSETDFTDDLKVIDVPTLVMHGDDDQIVPIASASRKSVQRPTMKLPVG